MSELKATPGPWVLHPLQAWVSPEADIDMPICALRMGTGDVSNEAQARVDGKLIASAPCLYEALDEVANYSGGADSALDDEYVMDRVRAALARARGQS